MASLIIRRLVGPGGLLPLFGAVSLAAAAFGAMIAAAHGAPAAIWIRNIAAWGVGALLAAALATFARAGAATTALCAATLGLAASFLSPGMGPVHRWIDLGPLHLNAAMLLLPAAVVALAALGPAKRWPWLATTAALCLLAAQPDASQATALASAAALIATVSVRQPTARTALVVGALGLAAASWLRPDPLPPVAEVEGIVGLAFALSSLAGALALLLLVAVAAAPVISVAGAPAPTRTAGAALGLYLLASAAMPFLGAFPVPLVGMGMSPIIGAWLGVGLLAALGRHADG